MLPSRSAPVFLTLLLASSCGDPAPAADEKLSALGESCQKAADCAGKLTCLGGTCVEPGTVVDAASQTDGGVGADSTPATTDAADGEDVVVDADTDSADAAGPDAIVTCVPKCSPGSCTDGCGGLCAGDCNDGDLCTTADACKDGACAGTPQVCVDDNPCTDDTCDKASGCLHSPNVAACDDDNPCTIGDKCQDSVCTSGKPKDCNSGDTCVVGKCSLSDGKCKFTDAADGTACDDGSKCTAVDTCSTGTCKGEKVDCNDNNPCTGDLCDPSSGCTTQLLTGACDDGNPCTEGDTCKEGACVKGSPKACKDDSPCTADSCNVKSGACDHNPAPFEGTACDADGSACTIGDTCTLGVCTAGKMASCDDGNACTADSCDVKVGCQNQFLSGTCNADDNACTADLCGAGTCTAGAPKACTDGNPCTTDVCDTKTGQCSFSGVADGSACDADNSKCTAKDACKSGVCLAGGQVDCNDDNPCTDDACVPQAGCVYSSNKLPCDADGSACTVGDACKNSVCQAGAATNCSDGNPCTDDACDTKTGACSHANNAAPCTDGTPCTKDDVCNGGACTGVPTPCDPCLNYGGTEVTVAAGHTRICNAKITGDEILKAAIPIPWRICSKADLLKYAPNKTLYDFNYCGASDMTMLWTGETCGSPGLVLFGMNVYSCSYSPLNDSFSYKCTTNGSLLVAARPFFVCRD